MEINHVTLKPSLLIGSRITALGASRTKQVCTNTEREGAKEVKHWDVTRVIPDMAQFKMANVAVAKCKALRDKACKKMAFGYVCPKDGEGKLNEAMKKIDEIVAQTNAKLNNVEVVAYFIRAEIVSDDKAFAATIAADINGFFKSLSVAIDKADSKAITRALQQMKGLDTILPDMQSAALTKAVKAAKKAAKVIASEVEKKARSIDEVKAELDLTVLDTARAAFIEAEAAPAGPVIVDEPVQRVAVEA